MATEDCIEIGRGSCPCGKGIVAVERCTPDHPWARDSQARHKNSLECADCKQQYVFFGEDPNKPARLVLASDNQQRDEARAKWHRRIREIEASESFVELAQALYARLAKERSATARHRLLTNAGMAFGLSLSRYRKHDYKLKVGDVPAALKLLGVSSLPLTSDVEQAEQLWKGARAAPPGVLTGVKGLEM